MLAVLRCLSVILLGTLVVNAEDVHGNAPIVMPKMRIRGDDVDLTISYDPSSRLVLAIVVDQVAPNSTAEKSGLRAGYQIERVNGTSVTKLRYDDVVSDGLNRGQSLRFVSPRIFGLYRKVVTVSFGLKPNHSPEPTAEPAAH